LGVDLAGPLGSFWANLGRKKAKKSGVGNAFIYEIFFLLGGGI
jgi:hypothetical protein